MSVRYLLRRVHRRRVIAKRRHSGSLLWPAMISCCSAMEDWLIKTMNPVRTESGQIYRSDNPLLKKAAQTVAGEAAYGRALGHDTGPEFIYVHLNRVFARHGQDIPEILNWTWSGPNDRPGSCLHRAAEEMTVS